MRHFKGGEEMCISKGKIFGVLIIFWGGSLYSQLQQSPWPMFHHDVRHTGRSENVGPETPDLLWSYNIGAPVEGSPAIDSGGTIYIGAENGVFYAINPDGTLKWSYQISNGTFPYIRGTPAINADGTVYIGQWDTERVYAFNPDGSLKWISEQVGAVSFSGPAIGEDGTVYVLGCGFTRGLSAINPQDGSIIWRFTTGDTPNAWNEGSPAIGENGVIYFGSGDAHVYCVDSEGNLVWSYPDGIITRGAAIGEDGTVYIGSCDHKLYAFNPDGSLKWTFEAEGRFWSSPALGSDGTIYIGCDDGKVYAIEDSITYGHLKWTFQTGSYVVSAPAIDATGTIYVGSLDWKMYAINPDGSLKWVFQTNGEIDSSPAIGGDGTIYFGSEDGHLYAIGPGQSVNETLLPIRISYTLNVSPNPSKNFLKINIQSPQERSLKLSILNLAGRVEKSIIISVREGKNEIEVPFNKRGTYFILLENVKKKIVIW
jgi:outer membrane protein assembly factor BamB